MWPDIDWYLLEKKKKGKFVLVNVLKCKVMREYKDYLQIFTVGSKEPETGLTGFGAAVPDKGVGISRRTSDSFVSTVEMLAVAVVVGGKGETR